jgi:hypothetical protein
MMLRGKAVQTLDAASRNMGRYTFNCEAKNMGAMIFLWRSWYLPGTKPKKMHYCKREGEMHGISVPWEETSAFPATNSVTLCSSSFLGKLYPDE